jgi:drug/metabolite transporter (DMT)-like permease
VWDLTPDAQGKLCALLAAMSWALALVLFKQSGESVPPLALNLFKNVVGLALFGLTLLATALLPALKPDAPVDFMSPPELLVLAVSGLMGIAVADTLFFASLNRTGVQLNQVVDCLYTPSMLLFAWLLAGEDITRAHWLGSALIVAGILVATSVKPPPNRTRGQIGAGILFGAGAMLAMAYSIALAKPILDARPVLWTTATRLTAGTCALALWSLVTSSRRATWAVFRPAPVWRRSIPAAVLGVYLSMLLWISGFAWTTMASAAILNQTSIVFALALAAVLLRERLSRRKIVAIGLASGGVVVATFGSGL